MCIFLVLSQYYLALELHTFCACGWSFYDTQEGGVQLQAALDEDVGASVSSSSATAVVQPSVWLAFRLGEHGTATLLDRRDAHLRTLEVGSARGHASSCHGA